MGDLLPLLNPTPHHLLPEILGFSPQLLLDDIINIANNAVQDGVNGMEEFLQKWADERTKREGSGWDSTREVEQGLVAFQTLLEYHTDIAFDFFEAWSLRNIFAISSSVEEGELPVVVPHQKGLDLTCTAERERALMEECEELRRKIDNQRRVKRLYTRALLASTAQRRRAEHRLAQISMLKSPSLPLFSALPTKVTGMYQSMSSLPALDPTSLPVALDEPGKRLWETSKTGYMNWAVGQLVERSREDGGGMGEERAGRSKVDVLCESSFMVGSAESLREVAGAIGVSEARGGDMDTER